KAWGAASKVLCPIFETDGIPQRWAEDCNKFDEVWVPSHFNYETFSNSGVDKSKLWIIPYAIDTKLFKPAQSARPGSQPFTFLYIFSFGWRKGFDILLEAFLGEFKKGEAKLVMRAFTAGYQGVNKAQLADTLMDSVAGKVNLADPSLPEVEINDRALSADDLLKLYANSDMYISTDRANGWGVPCMEAMALGKPAATIDWSGSTEFMKADNSFLIKPEPELEPVDVRLSDAVPHLYAGQRWAKVKVETVRAVMRDAYEHPEKRERLAAKGLEDIQEHFTPSAIAKRIVQHAESLKPSWLQRLRAGLGIPPLVYLGSTRVLLKHKLRGAAKRSG
ncbi:MAG TPA: glycosyltransferase family 4 protein, partial [Candidatus Polarisedimenticolaceae bacterium]|nr:glycosyltransferase family 4 protein [Candidatus Polarisedimenticolaceae bacterium]